MTFVPRFTITNRITADLTTIERARGFLEAATISEEWVRRMSQRALLLEAHHTTWFAINRRLTQGGSGGSASRRWRRRRRRAGGARRSPPRSRHPR